jgi:hypothetical protein
MSLNTQVVTGHVYHYENLAFYAINGMIALHDEEDGFYTLLTCEKFKARADALDMEANRLVKVCIEQRMQSLMELRDKIRRGAEQMRLTVAEAKQQGDRFDPAVTAWYLRHRPWSRSTVSTKGKVAFESTNPGPLPRGNFTGREAKPDYSIPGKQSRLLLPSGAL